MVDMSGEYNLILHKPSYSWKLSMHKIIFEQFLEEEIFTGYVLHILGCAIGIGCRYNYHVFYFMTLFFPFDLPTQFVLKSLENQLIKITWLYIIRQKTQSCRCIVF